MAGFYQEKTEPPTEKRLSDLKKKGIIPKSKDITSGVMLFFNIVIIFMFSPYMYSRFRFYAIQLYENLDREILDVPYVINVMQAGLWEFLMMMLPMLVGTLVVGVLVELVQMGFVFSVHPMVPRWSNLNIFDPKNYHKYYSFKTLLRLTLGQTRFFTVTIASFLIVGSDLRRVYLLNEGSAHQLLKWIYLKAVYVGLFLGGAFILIGLIDFFYQRRSFTHDHMMSKDEVAEERKLIEGNVQLKKKAVRALRRLMYRQAPYTIPNSHVVITDQYRRLAIALRYDPKSMAAPKCQCKGIGRQVNHMVMLAQKNEIPVVENTRIANNLFATTEQYKRVIPEHFQDSADALKEAALIKRKRLEEKKQ